MQKVLSLLLFLSLVFSCGIKKEYYTNSQVCEENFFPLTVVKIDQNTASYKLHMAKYSFSGSGPVELSEGVTWDWKSKTKCVNLGLGLGLNYGYEISKSYKILITKEGFELKVNGGKK